MEWKEQFDSALDFPEPVDPSVRYAICSTPRSGSHMLGQLLYATGKMGCPLEYFNPGNLVRWQARAQVAGAGDLIRFLQGIRTSPNGCFGLKAHFTHLPALAQYIPLGDFVTRFTHVHIVRRDLLAQAISFARATQTGEWISRTSASDRTATYDGPLIRRCLVELARQHASWEHLFHGLGLRPHVVEYESLAADPPRAIRDVASFVGIDLSAEVEIPGPRTCPASAIPRASRGGIASWPRWGASLLLQTSTSCNTSGRPRNSWRRARGSVGSGPRFTIKSASRAHAVQRRLTSRRHYRARGPPSAHRPTPPTDDAVLPASPWAEHRAARSRGRGARLTSARWRPRSRAPRC